MSKLRRICALLCVAFMALPAHAVTVEKPLDDPKLEKRAHGLFTELKCVVCEGQALAESDAPLAIDMRQTIRNMLRIGQSDEAIRAYFATRYGDGILLTPPVNQSTTLLWLMPVLALGIGIAFLWSQFRGPKT